VPSVPVAVAVAVAVGAASVAYMTATSTIAQIRTEQSMIGRVLAIQAVLFVGTKPIGGPILGGVTDVYGARWAVVIGGVGALVAAVLGWLAVKRTEARRPA
jgi:MFS family permease